MLISLVGGLVAFSVVLSLSCRQARCSWVLGLPQWFFPTPNYRFGPSRYFSYSSLRCGGFCFVPFPWHQTSLRSFHSGLGIWSCFPPSNSLNLLFHRRYKGKLSVLPPHCPCYSRACITRDTFLGLLLIFCVSTWSFAEKPVISASSLLHSFPPYVGL